jgi:hypothetical protein
MSEYLVDYKIITVYPTIAYLTYLFCKKYYKYILYYNLLVLDIYDNTNNYINTNNMIVSSNKSTQTNNTLLAFNEIPT